MTMKRFSIFLFLLISCSPIFGQEVLEPVKTCFSPIFCRSKSTYSTCYRLGESTFAVSSKTDNCTTGLECDDLMTTGLPCKKPEPPIPPTCTYSGLYVGPHCYDYWECKAELVGCPDNQHFDRVSKQCIAVQYTTCIEINEYTSPSNCTRDGYLQSNLCSEAWQCSKYNSWYNLFKISCSTGYHFDLATSKCISVAVSTCQNFTKATAAPVCTKTGNFTGSSCFDYWKCNAVLKECPRGQYFDSVTKTCLSKDQCLCGHM